MPPRILLLVFILLRGCSLHAQGLWNWASDDFEVLMRTHGQATFAPYVHGGNARNGYPQFLVERYTSSVAWNLWNQWDYQFNLGTFLYGKPSAWLAQNHIYRYERSGLIQAHPRRWGRWDSISCFKDKKSPRDIHSRGPG